MEGNTTTELSLQRTVSEELADSFNISRTQARITLEDNDEDLERVTQLLLEMSEKGRGAFDLQYPPIENVPSMLEIERVDAFFERRCHQVDNGIDPFFYVVYNEDMYGCTTFVRKRTGAHEMHYDTMKEKMLKICRHITEYFIHFYHEFPDLAYYPLHSAMNILQSEEYRYHEINNFVESNWKDWAVAAKHIATSNTKVSYVYDNSQAMGKHKVRLVKSDSNILADFMTEKKSVRYEVSKSDARVALDFCEDDTRRAIEYLLNEDVKKIEKNKILLNLPSLHICIEEGYKVRVTKYIR